MFVRCLVRDIQPACHIAQAQFFDAVLRYYSLRGFDAGIFELKRRSGRDVRAYVLFSRGLGVIHDFCFSCHQCFRANTFWNHPCIFLCPIGWQLLPRS